MSGIYRYCRYETAEKTSFYDNVVVFFPWKFLEKQKDSVNAHNSHKNGAFGENLNMHSILLLIFFSLVNAM